VAIIDHRGMVGRSIVAALNTEGIRARYSPLTRGDALRAVVERDTLAVGVVAVTVDEACAALDIIEALADAGASVLMMVDSCVERITIAEGLAAGAAGYVATSDTIDGLCNVLVDITENHEVIALGERYDLEDVLRKHRDEVTASLKPFQTLTPRETDVLTHLVAGKHAELIADEAFVALSTVRSQIKAILCKLQVHSQLEAVALANEADWPRAAAAG
jgi:DNA-binding NarL/FixJ family response regulator